MRPDVSVTACDDKTHRGVVDWFSAQAPADPRHEAVAQRIETANPSDVIVARRGPALVGFILSVKASGRIGWVWPPYVHVARNRDCDVASIEDALCQSALGRLVVNDVCFVQCLLQPDLDEGAVLERNGFERMTEIIRMRRELQNPISQVSPNRVVLVAVPAHAQRLLENVVLQTYEKSMDCPELDSQRTISDVLAGYRSAGRFRESNWCFAIVKNDIVGCVLMAELDEGEYELQYMGVIPTRRGSSLGASLCAEAMVLAAQQAGRELWLSVDARNLPAIRHYKSAGFNEVNRWVAYVRTLSETG